MMRESKEWRHLLSTRPRTSGAQLSASIVNNRTLVDAGLTMESLFDFEGTDSAARALLESEESGSYFYGYAPVQMRLVDHREVLLHGPPTPSGDSILSLTDDSALAAARAYWRAVTESAVPCRIATPPAGALTARQRQVLELLRQDLNDERIAAAIGVSVRTVRYEVAAVIEIFGVRTRFAAGYAYARAQITS
jgi:DNA-binding CsgD family transcriptional regulator